MNTTQYLRKALASQNSQRIDFKKSHFCRVTMGVTAKGELPASVYADLWKNCETGGKQKRDLEVLIAAKTARVVFDESVLISKTNDLTGVFFVPAILHEDGSLSHNEEKFPWFVREFLEPMIEPELSLGNAENVDAFLSENIAAWHAIENWTDYWQYNCEMYQAVTGAQISAPSIPSAPQIKFEQDCFIFLDNTVFAAHSILMLYDKLLEIGNEKSLSLYRNLTSLSEVPERPMVVDSLEMMQEHCGQMGCSYPLSESQRNAINYLNCLREGEALAVSGPPGTGKTTLLQSVVADLVTKHALEKKDAPIIVASSTNNQAVTNIIDSFAGLESVDGSNLDKRWVAAADSLATFFPAASRKAQANDYQTDEDMIRNLNCKDTHTKSCKAMLDACRHFFREPMESVGACKTAIYRELTENEKCKRILLEKHAALMKLTNQLPAGRYIDQITEQKSALGRETEEMRLLIQKKLDYRKALSMRAEEWQIAYKERLPWYVRLLPFIPSFSDKIIQWALGFRSEQEIDAVPMAQTLKEILAFYQEQILKVDRGIHSLTEKENDLKLQISRLESCAENVENALREIVAVGDVVKKQQAYIPPKDVELSAFFQNATLNDLNDYLDTSMRWRSFWLAVHYYECAWLENGPIDEDDIWKTTCSAMSKKYRQLALLTPCFVMTFYRLPLKFRVYKEEYLIEFIDLLIVDEAGQTSPEVAAASFALAKKAVVVGDEHQIPPVWGVERALDIAIAKDCGVIQKEEDFSLLENCGLNTSQSSVMKLSYQACPYHMYEKGLLLREHRRCYDEIIAYCNDLVYQGRLLPLRGWGMEDAKRPELMKAYPVIGYRDIPVPASEKTGSSRKNTKEADAIAKWIKANFDALCGAYENEKTENILAVITPFAAQAREITAQLRKEFQSEHLPVKVGTVHTFQGAEKKIIIYSTTYGSTESGYFIENNSNLMNVAVSRAKDAFWVFGSIECLSNGIETSAKGLLYKYVRENSF